MMIDFALEAERDEGLPPGQSIYQACLLRFRPIMMTTLAALLGALPLALGNGTGSELRKPLGIAIVGGLLLSQFITLYTTPVIYLYLDRSRGLGGQDGGMRGIGKVEFLARRLDGVGRPVETSKTVDRVASNGREPSRLGALNSAHERLGAIY